MVSTLCIVSTVLKLIISIFREDEHGEVARLRRADEASRKVIATYRAAQEKQSLAMSRINDLEDLLNVSERWGPNSPKYLETVKYMGERKFRLALDHLERLVVQRLFELEKTQIAGTSKYPCPLLSCSRTNIRSTGYKMRTHIGKHLQSRAKAITAAVNKYNAAARALTPPRPTITTAEVLNRTFLSEFDLFRDSRNDVRTKPWADPTTRLYIDQYFQLVRAKEEVERLNVEIRRMKTWMRDDEAYLKAAIERLRPENPDVAFEIQRRLRVESLVHIRIAAQLKEVESYRGYTGDKTYGEGEYTAPAPPPTSTLSSAPSTATPATPPIGTAAPDVEAAIDDDAESVGSEDDDRRDVLDGLGEAVDRLAS